MIDEADEREGSTFGMLGITDVRKTLCFHTHCTHMLDGDEKHRRKKEGKEGNRRERRKTYQLKE